MIVFGENSDPLENNSKYALDNLKEGDFVSLDLNIGEETHKLSIEVIKEKDKDGLVGRFTVDEENINLIPLNGKNRDEVLGKNFDIVVHGTRFGASSLFKGFSADGFFEAYVRPTVLSNEEKFQIKKNLQSMAFKHLLYYEKDGKLPNFSQSFPVETWSLDSSEDLPEIDPMIALQSYDAIRNKEAVSDLVWKIAFARKTNPTYEEFEQLVYFDVFGGGVESDDWMVEVMGWIPVKRQALVKSISIDLSKQ